MKVSVITVCFNAVKNIEKALVSIQAQAYSNIEKVIIDGGSSDGTQDIVRRYLSPGDKFISEKDDGIYDAMNKGIQTSSGHIIYFLNSDDSFCNTNVVKNFVKEFESNRDLLLVYGVVERESVPTHMISFIKDHEIVSKYDFLDKTICHQAVFVKKEIFSYVGLFDSKYQYFADYSWLISAYKMFAQRFKFINHPVAIYFYQGRSFQNRRAGEYEKINIVYKQYRLHIFIFYLFRYVFLRKAKCLLWPIWAEREST